MGAGVYRWIAGLYDIVLEPLLASAKRQGVSFHTPPPDGLVLDVGCGTGAQLRLYRAFGCRLAGVDASPAMAAQAARKLGPAASIHLGDGSSLPYEDATVDLVLLSMALHEMPPAMRAAVLTEATRVLTDVGRILVLDYHTGPRTIPWGWAAGGGIFGIEWLAGGEHFANFRQFLSAGGVPPLAARLGLRIETSTAMKGGNLGLFLLRAA